MHYAGAIYQLRPGKSEAVPPLPPLPTRNRRLQGPSQGLGDGAKSVTSKLTSPYLVSLLVGT